MAAPHDPDPIEAQVLRWFRDQDVDHPAVRILFEVAVERRRARTVAEGSSRSTPRSGGHHDR
ncbi:MAG: hypothetical protein R3F59_19440 [Myxococcota bacterium]